MSVVSYTFKYVDNKKSYIIAKIKENNDTKIFNFVINRNMKNIKNLFYTPFILKSKIYEKCYYYSTHLSYERKGKVKNYHDHVRLICF